QHRQEARRPAPSRGPIHATTAGGSARSERSVGGEHQADRDDPGLQGVLGLWPTGVEADELPELHAVGRLEPRLAERALWALGRTAKYGRATRALAPEVGQGLEAVLVGECLRYRERVLVGRGRWLAEGQPDLAAKILQRGHRLVHITGGLRLNAGPVDLLVQKLGQRPRVLG